MSDIDVENIRRLDGSLLLILRELLLQRRTTLVAQRLGLSQSAISHTLSRLRELFGDPLFVRKPYGLEPTRRALELGPQIEALLLAMSQAMGQGDGFTPRTTTRAFRIAAPDHLTTLVAPPLLEGFARHAPAARFAFSQRLGEEALEALRRDEIDLALGRFGARASGLTVEPLLEDHYCLVARRRHPKLKGKLTPARYTKLDHVQISVAGDFRSPEIEPVGGEAMPRHTVAAVPRFLIAFAVVSQSDAVAIAPARLAKRYARSFGLTLHALPFALPPIRMLAVRGARADPGVDWLLEQIRTAVAA
ncbi:MAG: LysR family transcriptional regulator [Polyangiales bacterium]